MRTQKLSLPVVAAVVPERVTASGIVGKDELKVTLPDGFDPKTAQVSVTVAPTLAADLADTLPYLVESRELMPTEGSSLLNLALVSLFTGDVETAGQMTRSGGVLLD